MVKYKTIKISEYLNVRFSTSTKGVISDAYCDIESFSLYLSMALY